MYETVGKRIKTYKNVPFHWFLDKLYTVLYIFLQFNTFSYNSEIVPYQVCTKFNVMKRRKSYKNVYFCIFP